MSLERDALAARAARWTARATELGAAWRSLVCLVREVRAHRSAEWSAVVAALREVGWQRTTPGVLGALDALVRAVPDTYLHALGVWYALVTLGCEAGYAPVRNRVRAA